MQLESYGDVMTVEEVATVMRVTPHHVRLLCREGDLPGAFKWGRTWRIPRAAAEAKISGQRYTPDGPLFGAFPEVMTPREVADAMHSHPRQVRALADAGQLPGAFKWGPVWRVLRSCLEALATGQATPADPLAALPDTLTTREVAAAMRTSPRQVWEAAQRGELKGFRVRREWRFLKAPIRDLLLRAAGGAHPG
ncbi:helix-turn-helix domain-containing protein [Streptomyces sp. NPDC018045]|uniref:helix-turn-helix domain-containing protein n=1 Tax=Streptomyces sp. NPDC018045 TaxID=3365037 RepID=UPI0037B9DD5F